MEGSLLAHAVFWVAIFGCVNAAFATGQPSEGGLKILDGKPKLIVVNGYSTSAHWPAMFQRKLDRYTGGRRVVEVRRACRGGSSIPKWMDVKTGRRLEPWTRILQPALKEGQGRPVIVLAQQSLQWVFGKRTEGIRSRRDTVRIGQGAEVLRKYSQLLLEDGADRVVIAMHIYKEGMEPEIGNERLALAEFLRSQPACVYAGPDVWPPTKENFPGAFAEDRKHPNQIGAEIMAQKWFEALLEREGLEVPEWSRKEMEIALSGETVDL